jgi:hypothetical protein
MTSFLQQIRIPDVYPLRPTSVRSAARRGLFCLVLLAVSALPALALAPTPSRKASKDCAWHTLSDPGLGLAAWVQSCDYGKRKIEFRVGKGALLMHYSDGDSSQPVIDVFDLKSGESAEAGLRRIFVEHTDKKVAARCVLSRYTESPTPKGVEHYTFVPDKAYQKQLDAKHEDGVPDPPCGDFGISYDGIGYFEVQPASAARKVLFVNVGQDEPLFDEMTLQLLPAPRH